MTKRLELRSRQRPRSALSRLLLLGLGIIIFYGGYYWGNQHAPNIPEFSVLRLLDPPLPLTSLSLRDQYNKPFTEERLRAHWNLVLFGYTRSEESSRDSLSLATRVINRLADLPRLQQTTRALFVSLDPEYDSPEVLMNFINRFSPDFLALTGTPIQVQTFARKFGVIYSRVDTETGEFRIDHSTSIGVIDPEGLFVGLFTGLVDEVSIASDLKRLAERYRN